MCRRSRVQIPVRPHLFVPLFVVMDKAECYFCSLVDVKKELVRPVELFWPRTECPSQQVSLQFALESIKTSCLQVKLEVC